MLNIVRSNRVEALLEGLAERLREAPPASPFTPECVVVPSPAMARWVNLQLARRHGAAANIAYPLPASFVWGLARDLLADLPDQDPLNREALTWRVFAVLPGLTREPPFEPLNRYLGADPRGLRRFELAARIADVLDRYLFYRPQLIRGWDEGQGGDWQAVLWRRLAAGAASAHRVAVVDRLLGALSGTGPFPELPERVSLFAVSSLPPLLVAVLHALAGHTEVDLYLHAPTDAFWADLITQKALARKRLESPDEAALWEVGNGLLASWGRQGQALQDLLLDRDVPVNDHDAFVEPPERMLLGRLQQDIFTLREIVPEGERIGLRTDDSIQVHLCHGPLRECQVLHDRLLGMFEDDAELRPEDVLVMVPEISRYAPYIEAVFDVEQEGGRPFIPWNLSDISVRDEHPVVQVFLRLLALPESRFSLSEVLSYLDVPEVASRFGLDADAIARVKDWIDRANPRWGLDAAHKERLGLPGVVENTWAQAEQRLFAGYAVGDLGAFDGIVPLGGIEGAQADALGRFWHLLGTLSGAAERLAEPRSAVDWQRTIGALIDDLFGEREDEDGRLQRIRDAIAELAEQASGLDEALAPELVRRWLERRLGAVGRHGRYFSGGVTFCGMRPMRSLPFAVICVLGLQDQAFPRRERPADFDRMRRDWQPGDARAGDEDRYLFLETLLCARRRLYLSYVGRDSRRGSERQPSVLLRELLDYIDQQYRVAGGDEKARLSDRLTTVHPLQPFSLRNFTTGEGGYDADWCAVARDLRREDAWQTGPTSGWNGACLAEMPERTREIALVQLARFVRHPVRHFVHTRLRVFLRDDDPDEDDEIFSLDGLQRFVLRQRVVEEYMRGRALSPRWLSAEGALPHGAFAGLALERAERETAPLLQRLQPYLDDRPRSVPVALELAGVADPLQVCGRIDGIYPGPGLMRWRPGRLTGGDLLGLWIGHLAWCAVEPSGAKQSALHTADGSFVVDDTLDPEAARAALGRYLALYWQGLHRPLPVLPKASYAFALKRVQGGRGDPLREAYRAWNGSPFNGVPGDRDDVYIQFAMRGTSGDPVATDEFAVLAGELYGQALASGELL